MTTQQWIFPDPDKCNVVKDYISYRHPTNLTRWINGNTVEVTRSTRVLEKYFTGLGGKRVDKLIDPS